MMVPLGSMSITVLLPEHPPPPHHRSPPKAFGRHRCRMVCVSTAGALDAQCDDAAPSRGIDNEAWPVLRVRSPAEKRPHDARSPMDAGRKPGCVLRRDVERASCVTLAADERLSRLFAKVLVSESEVSSTPRSLAPPFVHSISRVRRADVIEFP